MTVQRYYPTKDGEMEPWDSGLWVMLEDVDAALGAAEADRTNAWAVHAETVERLNSTIATQASDIQSLRIDQAALIDSTKALGAEVDRLRALDAQMLEALRPFAAVLQPFHEDRDDAHSLYSAGRMGDSPVSITLGHVRVAAAICSGTEAVPGAMTALLAAQDMCMVALPQFNWGASALSAEAIRLLNETPGKIDAAIAQATANPADAPKEPT